MTENTQMREAFERDYFGRSDCVGRDRKGSGYAYLAVQSAWSQWQAAWTASRKAALEEAAKLCDESAAENDKLARIDRLPRYDYAADSARECAAAIRAEIDK